jgi:hypothetical protein
MCAGWMLWVYTTPIEKIQFLYDARNGKLLLCGEFFLIINLFSACEEPPHILDRRQVEGMTQQSAGG